MFQRHSHIIVTFLFIVFVFFSLALPALAQGDPLGTEPLQETGLSDQDPRIIAARIINASLGVLGTITIIIIIIGGFRWMTAGGNDDKVAQAKKIMAAGIVGLAIILSAYALSVFIINELLKATAGP